MNKDRLRELLEQVGKTNIAVLGDFCLDAYWIVDKTRSEVSVETGISTVPISSQYYSLGGAGNIVANLIDLGVAKVYPIGIVGDDLFGREMVRMLEVKGADAGGIIVQKENWLTPVYGKPYIGEKEEPRIDFGNYNQIRSETEAAAIEKLSAVLDRVQAVILNQQLPGSIASETVIKGINALVKKHADKVFIVDSRDRSELFEKAAYRFNAHEAGRLCGHEQPLDQGVLLEDVVKFADRLSRKTGRPIFISRGDRGSIVHWDGRTEIIPGIQILKKTDAVGAGDASMSAIAGALAAGGTPKEAAELANFASAVTVQKLRITGTATPEEIRAIGEDPDYIHRPELASDPRAARYVNESEIEVIGEVAPVGEISHAIFDHDGTVSSLRQGWEPIMESVFIRLILGAQYESADESVYRRIADHTASYISRSTGIQTLKQMSALADMVRDFGFVGENEILDAHGYKKIYLEALMETVNRRIEKLTREELDVNDFTIKGAVSFLKMLREKGVTLYLASGTDDADVRNEAQALGYAALFDGGIYGATEDIDHDAKRQVIERILSAQSLSGASLVCFGDGPVELREAKKRGGLAVGLASDEVRRYGLNPEKRARLICAGADFIIPDFSQPRELLECLFG